MSRQVCGMETGSSGRRGMSPRSEVLRPTGNSPHVTSAPGRVYRERVLVRVYDLGRTVLTRWHNEVSKGYGAFHTGVEVYGREWSFGMTFDDYSTGVTCNPPMMNPDHNFRETLCMGYTSMSPKEVLRVIEEMKKDWKGCTYHVLNRNCHCFSDELCVRLGVSRLPSWVNQLAGTGASTFEYLDSADSGYDGGKALFDFIGSMRRSVYNAFAGEIEVSEPERRRHEEQQRREKLQLSQGPAQHDPFSLLRRQ
mmetsp:Transcript_91495/g.264026  ORF Transcript_91495/g.264026 Transcript_91495/m.264026 type:complete len:252 (-) Transcript_91495:58-813(-)